jgi:hypothetical protein
MGMTMQMHTVMHTLVLVMVLGLVRSTEGDCCCDDFCNGQCYYSGPGHNLNLTMYVPLARLLQ